MRSYEEIGADLASTDRHGVPWPGAARRLLVDAAMMLDRLHAVEALIEQARKVSPSSTMTIYVGDLEVALGRGDRPRGIVGQNDAAAADAPQPEHPEQPHEFTPTPRLVSDRCYCGESRYSPLHRPAPPADPPTKCDHGLTEPHDYHRPFSNGTRETIHCPGPSPAVLPEDGCAECTEAGTKNCTAGCRPPTSTHTRPTPQADRRRAELERFARLGEPEPPPDASWVTFEDVGP